MFFDYTYNSSVIPSGVHFGEIDRPNVVGLAPPPDFTKVPPGQLYIELCNPMQRQPIPAITLDEAPLRFAADLREKHKTRIVTTDELHAYGGALTDIRKVLDAIFTMPSSSR